MFIIFDHNCRSISIMVHHHDQLMGVPIRQPRPYVCPFQRHLIYNQSHEYLQLARMCVRHFLRPWGEMYLLLGTHPVAFAMWIPQISARKILFSKPVEAPIEAMYCRKWVRQISKRMKAVACLPGFQTRRGIGNDVRRTSEMMNAMTWVHGNGPGWKTASVKCDLWIDMS